MSITNENTTVGFIGLGVMGKSMAANILKAGYPLVIYSRTKAKAESLLHQGAQWKDSPREVAAHANVVITMVGYPKDVEEVYFGENGLICHAAAGTYLIDMTTSKPSLAQHIYEAASAKDIHALDAPVSGGDVGARDAKLTIMVGGDAEAFASVKKVLGIMGTNIVLQGRAGAGQYTKMCNQIAIASNMIGVCESMAYARKAGLDPSTVLQSIGTGAAGSWSLSNLAPRMLADDFAPGFYVKHFIKDMGIALESAEEIELALPGLELAKSLYDDLVAKGEADSGTQVLLQWYIQSS